MRYNENLEEALTAGLLHDCAKYGSAKEQIKECKKYQIKLEKAEIEVPALIHAKLGAYLAEKSTESKIPESWTQSDTTPPDVLTCQCWIRSSILRIILNQDGR